MSDKSFFLFVISLFDTQNFCFLFSNNFLVVKIFIMSLFIYNSFLSLLVCRICSSVLFHHDFLDQIHLSSNFQVLTFAIFPLSVLLISASALFGHFKGQYSDQGPFFYGYKFYLYPINWVMLYSFNYSVRSIF